MTLKRLSAASLPLLALASICLTGCEAPDNSGSANAQTSVRDSSLTPKRDSPCTVHFVRDALGVADKSPVPITSGNHNGATITLSGRIQSMNDQWLVLSKTDKEQYWVARDHILYLQVHQR